MKSMINVLGLGLVMLAAGCAQDAQPGSELDVPSSRPASSIGVQIERAERSLDRGGDAKQARDSMEAALQDPALGLEERRQALLALSRAHEKLGEREQAIALIEQEIAGHSEDRSWEAGPFEARLRKLLTGAEQSPGPAPIRPDEVAPFAHVLLHYFPATADGTVKAVTYMAGGESSVSEELGTFNIRGALRQEKEKACPLCDVQVNVNHWRHQSDWMIIPQSQDKFGSALTVFYFDLGRNRIPVRYEQHLPMKVAEIEALLEQGKSFVLAKERAGAPPVLLLAAPRTAMLDDVERYLSKLDHLPTTLETVDVPATLRPGEIQAVVRGAWRGEARHCYEALLSHDPKAGGKLVLAFHVAPEGTLHDVEVETESPALKDDALRGGLRRAVETLRFPASAGETTVRYPITMTPD